MTIASIRRTLAAVFLLGAASAFAAASAIAEPQTSGDEFRHDFQKTLPLAAGARVSIEHKNGDIRVTTHKERDVRISAVIRVSSSDREGSEKFANDVRIETESGPGGVSIRTVYPEKKWTFEGRGHVSYSVNYEIAMPDTAPLQVRNRFGNVEVSGLNAAADVVNANGRVAVRQTRGNQRLENSFGPLELTDNAGNATLVNNNGTVSATNVQGTLELSNRFGRVSVTRVAQASRIQNGNGDVTLVDSGPANVNASFGTVDARNVSGTLEVENANGAIRVRDVKGAATLRTRFGAVEGRTIGGNVSVDDSNGAVTLDGIEGSVEVRGSFGDVRVLRAKKGVRVTTANSRVEISESGAAAYVRTTFGATEATRIQGDLTVESQNGSVRATEIQGGASVRTSFAAVSLESIGGPVEVDNQNGSVDVRASSPRRGGACDRISIKTSFGSIRLAVPEDSGWAVTARTSFGRIHSELPVTTSGSIGEGSLTGTIGEGRCPLTLTNSNGNIEIVKGAAPAVRR